MLRNRKLSFHCDLDFMVRRICNENQAEKSGYNQLVKDHVAEQNKLLKANRKGANEPAEQPRRRNCPIRKLNQHPLSMLWKIHLSKRLMTIMPEIRKLRKKFCPLLLSPPLPLRIIILHSVLPRKFMCPPHKTCRWRSLQVINKSRWNPSVSAKCSKIRKCWKVKCFRSSCEEQTSDQKVSQHGSPSRDNLEKEEA